MQTQLETMRAVHSSRHAFGTGRNQRKSLFSNPEAATQDTVLRGKSIQQGDKVVMWYVSANRDGDAIDRADRFLIDRKESKKHLSFGWGVHFCMGSRIAEMQLRVLWEEIMRRFRFIEVVGRPVRVKSCFVRGFSHLPVCVHPW